MPIWQYLGAVGPLRAIADALRESKLRAPMPQFGPPRPPIDGEHGERWWHIPVEIERTFWKRRERERCRVFFVIEGFGRGWEQMMFADPMEQFEPRAVMTLRRNESMDVPVAIRSPVSGAVSPSILRGWPRFDVPAWAARITSRAAMVDRAGYFDVPPGPHRLTLAILVPEVEIAVARRSYFLDVPEPGESNGGFRLALGDSVFDPDGEAARPATRAHP